MAFQTLRGAAAVDYIPSGEGTAFIGSESADILLSVNEAGEKLVIGDKGNDSITLDDSTAVVGTVTVRGGEGDDIIRIGEAVVANNNVTRLTDSSVNGGAGIDTLFIRGTQSSTIRGNEGEDTFNLRGTYNASVINGGSEGDVFNLDGAISLEGTKILGGNSNDGQILLDNQDITAVNSTVNGSKGNDSIVIGGGAADLTATGFTIFGGQGEDTITNNFAAAANILNNSVVTYSGDKGADNIVGGFGDGILNGGEDNDTLNGGAGDDTVDGGAGDDNIVGAADDDSLVGGDGDDIFNETVGSEDDDTITGGGGADTFVVGDDATYVFSAISDSPANFTGNSETGELAIGFDNFDGTTVAAFGAGDDLDVSGVDNALAGSVATTVNTTAITFAVGTVINDNADVKAAIEGTVALTASGTGTIEAYTVAFGAAVDDAGAASDLANTFYAYINDTNTIYSSGDMMVQFDTLAEATQFINNFAAAV